MDIRDLPPVPASPVAAAPETATTSAAPGQTFQPITVPAHMAGMVGGVVAPADFLQTARQTGDRLRAASAAFAVACNHFVAAVRAAQEFASENPRASTLWEAEELDLAQAAHLAQEVERARA